MGKLLKFLGPLALLVWAATVGQAAEQTERFVGSYGFLPDSLVRLRFFTKATDLERALDLLEQRKPNSATPMLEAALNRDTDDVGAYAALMQCRPQVWKAEIARLERAHSSPVNEVKLALLLHYRVVESANPDADGQSAAQGFNNPIAFLPLHKRAHQLALAAWNEAHLPLAAALLVAMSYPDRRADIMNKPSSRQIIDNAITVLSNTAVFRQFENARRGGWGDTPPWPSNVPTGNRRALIGILTLENAFYPPWTYEMPRDKAGNIIPGKPARQVALPAGVRAHAYLASWMDELAKYTCQQIGVVIHAASAGSTEHLAVASHLARIFSNERWVHRKGCA